MTASTPEQRADAWRRLRERLAEGPLAVDLQPYQREFLATIVPPDEPVGGGGQYQYGPAHVRWGERVTIRGWAK